MQDLLYEQRLRSSPFSYFLLIITGAVAGFGAWNLLRYYSAGIPCNLPLHAAELLLASLFYARTAWGLLQDHRWGSRISPGDGQLYWWDTASCSGQRSLPLASIARIRLGPLRDDEGDTLLLFDQQGQRLPFPAGRLIPQYQRRWAEELVRRQPAIELEVTEEPLQ